MKLIFETILNLRRQLRLLVTVIMLGVPLFSLQGCGVKGDPLPPVTPLELTRGGPRAHRVPEETKPLVIPPDSLKKANDPNAAEREKSRSEIDKQPKKKKTRKQGK
ncbi:MAG: hypothetical protein COT74_04365 [Bdellovibrionales bacterium CG10_big_fil_rev_8_21_14_0_10_45_34]|nr:MAG: hypothetical protein COT74_04365 [Bdellovibrionales bacterium CG10_big_fil_rev_8_21_14_0_10_45_34]